MTLLKGTEKQIIWAENIKAEMLQGLKIIKSIKKIYIENITHPKLVAVIEELEGFKNKVETEIECSWFIDNKFLLTHIASSDYSKEVLTINVFSIVKDDFINAIMADGKVKKDYCDTFYL